MRARSGVASAALAAVLTSFLLVLVPAARAQPDPAAQALQFLVAHQAPDGSLGGSPGETEDLVLGAVANRYDPATLVTCGGASAYGYLAAHVTSSATADAGRTAKLVLAVAAGGRSVRSFGGADLLARLGGYYHSTSGAFGDGSTFGQALSVLALRAAGQPIPTAAVAHLVALQDADGSWNYLAATGATGGDTNSTAMALMAIAAVDGATAGGMAGGDVAPVTAAIAWLHAQQLPDGGFPYQPGTGAISDPDSDALVLQALIAVGQAPQSGAWTTGGHTIRDDLLSFQAADGGFTYPGNRAPDAFTTSQVPAAIAGAPLPITASLTAGRAVPRAACPAPGASPRASAAPPAGTAHSPAPPAMLPPTTTHPSSGAAPGAVTLPLLAAALLLAASAALGTAALERRAAGQRR